MRNRHRPVNQSATNRIMSYFCTLLIDRGFASYIFVNGTEEIEPWIERFVRPASVIPNVRRGLLGYGKETLYASKIKN